MPKSYIARLVYDRVHMSIAIVRKPLAVVGGITYRPFKHRKFVNIVFCAVLSDEQAKGCGAHLMSHLKDYIKASSDTMHLLTYADNLAIPYFKKQAYTKEITLDDSIWKGCIKDYEGGTLMQCSMLPRIRYLEAIPPRSELQAAATSPNDLQNHQSSWPFRQPVSEDDVADYYEVIKAPMDLSTMEARLEAEQYMTPEDFIKDARLIFENCRQFNDENSLYAKCANKLEKYMWQQIRTISELSHLE
ncbi:hypothetical protein MRS44_013793 [Fusarium solani]|uniref:uncharacterized protein n=1 Tax=Fusarium solani TaxID=169388 RepID=UPI0032C414EA|nr:hypothetical protein MRS44_013793 [Fusarium solani]